MGNVSISEIFNGIFLAHSESFNTSYDRPRALETEKKKSTHKQHANE